MYLPLTCGDGGVLLTVVRPRHQEQVNKEPVPGPFSRCAPRHVAAVTYGPGEPETRTATRLAVNKLWQAVRDSMPFESTDGGMY